MQDRLQLLSVVVDMLPKDQLHLIPELLSEAVLGTKEVNEKARDAGFDLILVMARKMAEGGTVRQAVDIADDEEMVKDGKSLLSRTTYKVFISAQDLRKQMSRSTSQWSLPVSPGQHRI